MDHDDRRGSATGLRAELERRLAKLAPFHPSSTAEAARTARRSERGAERRASDGSAEDGHGDRKADNLAAERPADGAGGRRNDGQAHADRGVKLADRPGGHEEADTERPAHRAEVLGKGPSDGEATPGSAGDRTPDQPESDYWNRVTEFEQLWERHVERWPGAPEDGGRDLRRPGDPPGSWRGDGGRYLTPEQNAEADRLIAALRAPEQEITALMRAIEADNIYGGRLAGLEHRLKGTHRLKEKIADKVGFKVGVSPADAVSTISDAVRYTFEFDRTNYVLGYGDIRRLLGAMGCRMSYSKNRWIDDPQYKGVNTRWVTPTGGRFELQFHTRESLHAKEHFTHKSYQRLRSRVVSWAERGALEGFQEVVAASVPRPVNVDEIEDHRRTT